MSYQSFVEAKTRHASGQGFSPTWIPDWLHDFQQCLTRWSVERGRTAILADCGMGKTPMQLVWAQNAIEHTNKPALIVTPLAVGHQTIRESDKFGIDANRTRDGKSEGGFKPKIYVTNYEQLHKYDPALFGALVCDESSAIKDFKTQRRDDVTEFSKRVDCKLLCTATAAPNDYWELGTSSEALGYLGYRDMLTTFFKQETTKDYLGWGRTKYRFRGHAEEPFWSWVCSWARSIRKPSDIGFDDSRFILPPLTQREIIVETAKCRPGMLFAMAANDMREERAERRHSIRERCEEAVKIATTQDGPSVTWCELNDEADMMEEMLPGARQISGSMSDDEKEELFIAFTTGQLQRLVTKPKIGAWGLNWQHCSNVIVFPSHSFEQFYQLVRRCYRYGQTKEVFVSLVVSEGQRGILDSLKRKQAQIDTMFTSVVKHMADAMHLSSSDYFPEREEVPSWLLSTK